MNSKKLSSALVKLEEAENFLSQLSESPFSFCELDETIDQVKDALVHFRLLELGFEGVLSDYEWVKGDTKVALGSEIGKWSIYDPLIGCASYDFSQVRQLLEDVEYLLNEE